MSERFLKSIPLQNIRTNPIALREVNRESEGFAELVSSIKAAGVLNPIVVRQYKDPETGAMSDSIFELVDGLHRFTAAQESGAITEMPCQIINLDEDRMLAAQIIGNAVRVETRHADYATQLRRMLQRSPLMTESELAAMLGKSTEWIQARLSLNKIDNPRIKKLVNDGDIKLMNAVALSKLPVEEQLDYMERAMSQPPAEFIPLVTNRVKEIKEAKRAGAATAPTEFKPIAHLRRISEIQAAIAGPAAVVASLNGATSSEDVIRKSLEWVLSLDSATVEAARIKFENDKKAADDKRKARQEEAVKKKAAKAALASKEAQNAEAELLGKPLPFPEVREQLKKVAAEEAPTEG
jgi:ParB/RepB/Spo0J family partition protein